MYIESKAGTLNGPARIGRVTFSKSGRMIYYQGRAFLKVTGYKYNHMDVETRQLYWISGPRRDGKDRLYVSNIPIEIDEDVREEYWSEIRNSPENKTLSQV